MSHHFPLWTHPTVSPEQRRRDLIADGVGIAAACLFSLLVLVVALTAR